MSPAQKAAKRRAKDRRRQARRTARKVNALTSQVEQMREELCALKSRVWCLEDAAREGRAA